MKQLLITMIAVPVLALVGAAQDPANVKADLNAMRADLEKMVAQSKVIAVSGGMMSSPVKGAPYSAVEVTENNHVLADGTRIHNEMKTTVYRDSEGRVRRETPNQTTIMDPVAGVTYFLNPKTMTATKANLSIPATFTKRVASPGVAVGGTIGVGAGGEISTYDVRLKDGVETVTVNGKQLPPPVLHDQAFVKLSTEQADMAAMDEMKLRAAKGGELGAQPALRTFSFGPGEPAVMTVRRDGAPGKTEALGKQTIEGVSSDGSRFTSTLEIGAIGNDRPIDIVNERWFSPELQTVTMTKHSDPRTGEESFRLTNVSRSEPGSDLFQVPTNYQIVDRNK